MSNISIPVVLNVILLIRKGGEPKRETATHMICPPIVDLPASEEETRVGLD